MRTISMVAKSDSDKALEAERRLTKIFKQSGFKIADEIYEETDAVVCLGGDGSLLATIRDMDELRYKIPVLGIHSSYGLGFLHPLSLPEPSVNFDEWGADLVRCLVEKKFRIRERWGLSCKISGSETELWALNDVVISKGPLSRMVSLKVQVGDAVIWKRLRGDGLIVASAVGSTAYSLSAGGPVVHPDTGAMLLTPICPHEIAQRPVVLGSSTSVDLEILNTNSPCWLTQDGQSAHELEEGQRLSVDRSRDCVKTIVPLLPELGSKNFYERLRTKLGLGGEKGTA